MNQCSEHASDVPSMLLLSVQIQEAHQDAAQRFLPNPCKESFPDEGPEDSQASDDPPVQGYTPALSVCLLSVQSNVAKFFRKLAAQHPVCVLQLLAWAKEGMSGGSPTQCWQFCARKRSPSRWPACPPSCSCRAIWQRSTSVPSIPQAWRGSGASWGARRASSPKSVRPVGACRGEEEGGEVGRRDEGR